MAVLALAAASAALASAGKKMAYMYYYWGFSFVFSPQMNQDSKRCNLIGCQIDKVTNKHSERKMEVTKPENIRSTSFIISNTFKDSCKLLS